jgi:glycosyltransferase involved in cell wall biosynthesis
LTLSVCYEEYWKLLEFKPMRVALVSTMRTAVPPVKTGSVELIVGLMAEELARRGHDVTVFAPEDSQVSTRVVSVLPKGYHDDPTIWDWRLAEFMQLGLVYEHAAEFDIINSHVYCYALPFTRLVRTPTVHTFHICPPPDFVRFCKMHADNAYVLISEFQRQFFADVPVSGVVHNGIQTALFPFNPEPGKYCAYLGDFRPDKGPLEAIRAARAAGIPIRLAGPGSQYFNDVIKPEIDGRNVEYVGELDHKGKTELLSGALSMMFPARGLEACPLVLLESMACGTPVLALSCGPVPEIVIQGVGGIHVDNVEDLEPALTRIGDMDRRAVRSLAVERYDVARMVQQYGEIFTRVVANSA